jgi:hypothetical protein
MATAGITPDNHGGTVTMKILFRRCAVSLALPGVLFLTGCSSTGTQYSSVNYSVYDGYGYPYYAYGGYYYDDDHHHNNNNNDDNDRPNRPDRPDRPIRPDRPTTLPATRPAGGMSRPVGGMGRPSGMSRGGGGGGRGRGGGGRGR